MLDVIASFLDYLRSIKRYSSHTLTSYKNDLDQFALFCRSEYNIEGVQEIMAFHLRTYLVHLVERKLAEKSINRKVSAIKSWLKYMHREGYIDADMADKMIPPKVPKRLPAYMKEKEMDHLRELIVLDETDFPSVRNRLVALMLYHTGMRRSELVGLNLEDVDMVSGILKVTGKGNKERRIPLTKQLVIYLKSYLELRKTTFPGSEQALFLTDKGSRIYPKMVYLIVRRVLSTVSSQEKRSPHVLRHTFATHLLNGGADLNAIKELLGHSSLAATQVYTHNSIAKLKDVYKKAHPKHNQS